MFRELIELWKGEETLIDEIVDEFKEMVALAESMTRDVNRVLFEGGTNEEFKKKLYKKDSKLNFSEQTIRRKIMSQLAGTGAEGPIASCLILMSVSKDAERLGDYAKNIYEIAEIKQKLEKEEPYYGRLLRIRDRLEELFSEVLKAYQESDKYRARELVELSYQAQRLCNENVGELLLADPANENVAYAVLTRYYKRCLAHLSNIATSIFMPVTKIDFFDEIRK